MSAEKKLEILKSILKALNDIEIMHGIFGTTDEMDEARKAYANSIIKTVEIAA